MKPSKKWIARFNDASTMQHGLTSSREFFINLPKAYWFLSSMSLSE
jgi:hypothetical protein